MFKSAVLLKARNDLVERCSKLPVYPEGYALMQNPAFQGALDRLDPDLPCHAQTPKEAAVAYLIGEFHLEKVQSWFAGGFTYEEYANWYFKRFTVW